MESILTSMKKLIGITEDYTQFDVDIIMHINSVFSTLAQLGVGPEAGFRIEDKEATWDEFIGDSSLIESVKSYMYLKLKLLFDVSSLGSATIAAYERQIAEYEFRLNLAAEST